MEKTEQKQMTYNMFFMVFRSIFHKKGSNGFEILLACHFAVFLLVHHVNHLYVVWDALSFRESQITLFTLGQLISVFQHCLFIYEPCHFGYRQIIFSWFNFRTFTAISLNIIFMDFAVCCSQKINKRSSVNGEKICIQHSLLEFLL